MAFATNADARTRLQEATGGWRARRRLFPPPPGSGRECSGHVGRIGRVTLMCRTCAGAPHSSGTPEDWNARMPRTSPATPGSPLPAAGLAAAAAARPGRMAVGVVGVGRVGAVLGAALRRAGHTIVAASAVSTASRTRATTLLPGAPLLPVDEVVARSELVLLAVPDDALPDLVDGLAATGAVRRGTLLVHVSGRYGLGVLAPAVRCGALPLALHPIMTFTGSTPDLDRLSGASFGVTLVAEAVALRGAAGVEHPARVIAPLLSAALDNALRSGDAALSRGA